MKVVIPAKAEILKRYIILHLEPILSNAQAMELDELRIRLCLCKIKYGGVFWITFLAKTTRPLMKAYSKSFF